MDQENKMFQEFNLSNNIQRALKEAGYESATPIQAQTIPEITNGRDLIGQSQTGTGKTAAFCLPIIEKINKQDRHVQAIIICPTRELALQITGELRKFTKYEEGVKCMAVYGGEPISRQIRALSQGVKIVVGTPGRMMDHMRRKTLKLGHVSTVVLDEADEMLNMGFEEDIRTILEKVPEDRQTLLFSATMNPRIMGIAERYLCDPVKVKTEAKELTVDKIDQISIEVRQNEKDDTVMAIIDKDKPKKTVIFCNTKRKVDQLVDILCKNGYEAEALHGDIQQAQRQKIMNRFKNGGFGVLVATDVAARGIDVDQLELVINYDIPQEEEYYVHRIGRTGRNGQEGKAVTLYGSKERAMLRSIERYAKTKITAFPDKQEATPLISKDGVIRRVQATIERGTKSGICDQILTELLKQNDALDVSKALIQLLIEREQNKKIASVPRTPAKNKSQKTAMPKNIAAPEHQIFSEALPLVRRGGYSKQTYKELGTPQRRNRKG